MAELVRMENLRIGFATPSGLAEAVRGVCLTIGREKLGIVGESGSGKSLTARAILKLLPAHARLTADRLSFDGIDVLAASERRMRRIRGRRAGLVLQDPKYSLNPIMTAGEQVAEAWRAHKGGHAAAGPRRRRRVAGPGAHPRPGPGGRAVSARAVRRDGPAGDDRHDAGARPRAADRRRADQRAGRDGAGRDHAPDRRHWCPAAAWGCC